MRKLLLRLRTITIFLAVAALFLVPSSAHAQSFACITSVAGFIDCAYGALGQFLWEIVIPIIQSVLSAVGLLIDTAITLSLTSSFYAGDAITSGWAIIRDLCNIIFIFVLIFTGIRTILGLDTGETRRVVISVIIGAVLINFSLFLTKAAIDVSNIFTAWITQGIVDLSGGTGGVSNSTVSVLKMSELYKTQTTGNLQIGAFSTAFAVIGLNMVAIYVFFKVAFLMFGRLVSFITLLIMSPIGFVGHLVPKLDSYAKQWRDELTKACLMAPMFLLMLYITLYLATKFDAVLSEMGQKLSLNSTNTFFSGNSFGLDDYTLFIIIALLLLKSLEVADEYTGAVAGQIGGIVKNSVGLVAGVGATRIIGGAGAALAKSGFATRMATSNNAIVRGLGDATRTVGTFAADSDFGIKSARSGLGFDKTPMLKNNLKGAEKGYTGDIKAYQKTEEDAGKSLGEISPTLQLQRGRVLQGKDRTTGEKIQPGLIGKVISRPLSSAYGVISGQQTTTSAIGNMVGAKAGTNYEAKIGGKIESAGTDAVKKERKNEAAKIKKESGLKDVQDAYEKEEKRVNEQKSALQKEIADIEKELAKFNDSTRAIDGIVVDQATYDFRKSTVNAGMGLRKKNITDLENELRTRKDNLERKREEVNAAVKAKTGVDMETAEKEGGAVEEKEFAEKIKKAAEGGDKPAEPEKPKEGEKK